LPERRGGGSEGWDDLGGRHVRVRSGPHSPGLLLEPGLAAPVRRDLPHPRVVGSGHAGGSGGDDRPPSDHLPRAPPGRRCAGVRAVRFQAGHEGGAEALMAASVQFQGGEPNGLAAMLGAIIEGNLAAHPELERLLATPATYAIVAPDVDVAVSIRLSPGTVAVRNGVVG